MVIRLFCGVDAVADIFADSVHPEAALCDMQLDCLLKCMRLVRKDKWKWYNNKNFKQCTVAWKTGRGKARVRK